MSKLSASRDFKTAETTDNAFFLGASMSEIGHIAVSTTSIKHVTCSKKENLNLIANKNEHDNETTTVVEAIPKKTNQFKGSIYAILSAFGYCASNVVMKKALYLSATDHALLRYLLTLLVFGLVSKYNNLELMGPRNQFKLLVIRGVIGTVSLLTFYFAIVLLNPSDTTTLIHSAIIITAVLSRLFLGEKLTIAHLLATILTANGVLFISKPTFLFPKAAHSETSNGTNTTVSAETTFESMAPVLGNHTSVSYLEELFFTAKCSVGV